MCSVWSRRTGLPATRKAPIRVSSDLNHYLLEKPSLRVSPLPGLSPVCKSVSAIRKMGGLVSWSVEGRSTGRGPPGPAQSAFRTYCGRRRGPEKRDRRPLRLPGRFDVLSPRSVGWLLGNWARRRRHSLNETFLSFLCKLPNAAAAFVIHENVLKFYVHIAVFCLLSKSHLIVILLMSL